VAVCESIHRRKWSHSDSQPRLRARGRKLLHGLQAPYSSSMKTVIFDIRLRANSRMSKMFWHLHSGGISVYFSLFSSAGFSLCSLTFQVVPSRSSRKEIDIFSVLKHSGVDGRCILESSYHPCNVDSNSDEFLVRFTRSTRGRPQWKRAHH
jgi:hypothetical protein